MLDGSAVEIRAPNPARYARQQSVEIKSTVPAELDVSLNNARGLMGVPGLA
ncbi:MAG TPA: hypothetical protein VG425_01545 [Casimicrobiaceae bacterium]|jgi:hypothetical protein|nr:hypothetical protein [Casimicrobiaceae bacterium]